MASLWCLRSRMARPSAHPWQMRGLSRVWSSIRPHFEFLSRQTLAAEIMFRTAEPVGAPLDKFGHVRAAAISRNGNWLLTGTGSVGQPAVVRLWNLRTGKQWGPTFVIMMKWSRLPSAQTIKPCSARPGMDRTALEAAAPEMATPGKWNAVSPSKRWRFIPMDRPCFRAEEASIFVSGILAQVIRRERLLMRGAKSSVLVFSPCGNTVVAAVGNSAVAWDVPSRTKRFSCPHSDHVGPLAFSPGWRSHHYRLGQEDVLLEDGRRFDARRAGCS